MWSANYLTDGPCHGSPVGRPLDRAIGLSGHLGPYRRSIFVTNAKVLHTVGLPPDRPQ